MKSTEEMTWANSTTRIDSASSMTIQGATIVTPTGSCFGALTIKDGYIEEIGNDVQPGHTVIDAKGKYLLPGIVDLHSDALEKFVEPRSGAQFPHQMAICEFDKYISACGITTMYHSICFMDFQNERQSLSIRSLDNADLLVRELSDLKNQLSVRTKIHVRYDLPTLAAPSYITSLLENGKIDFLSFMDHTPGQGQYGDINNFLTKRRKYSSEKDVEKIIEKQQQRKSQINMTDVEHVAALCREHAVPMASHDDDSKEKIEWALNLGISTSEFPITLDVAREARANDMFTCLGSPNVVRGVSHSNNLSARDAIKENLCDILCSDYAPMTMLHSVFMLEKLKIGSLHEFVKMISLNPARAVGIDDVLGSLEVGKFADMILVDTTSGIPRISMVIVGGKPTVTLGLSI